MINNFELIIPLLDFTDSDTFYFAQVIQRNKENPELGSNNNLVKAYYISSLKYLEKKKEEMIKIASVCNARIYIHLSKRSYKQIALELMENIAHQINSGQSEVIYRSYDSTCGKHRSKDTKKWIIDIDGDYKTEDLINIGKTIEQIRPEGNKILAEIPTKNGIHWITRPFDSQKFSSIYPDIQIHKNNPTILYIP